MIAQSLALHFVGPTAMFATTMFWLSVGHALCDFPLQGDYLSSAKRRHSPPGANGFWFFALTAHALIHGGAVAIVTGSALLGALEFGAHWAIDLSKCEGRIGMVTDQVLHFACKFLWAAIAVLIIGGAA